jgi:quercetin dioxygenase-like cupin family protein
MTRQILFLTLLAATAVTSGQAPSVDVIRPDSLRWTTPPNIPDIRSTWVVGSESASGPYAMRVKLRKGGRIPLHTHPDTRYSTVLSGTLYVGFGTVDDAQMVAVPAGSVYIAPANVPHHLWARDGEVEYQEAGNGPTGTAVTAAQSR